MCLIVGKKTSKILAEITEINLQKAEIGEWCKFLEQKGAGMKSEARDRKSEVGRRRKNGSSMW